MTGFEVLASLSSSVALESELSWAKSVIQGGFNY